MLRILPLKPHRTGCAIATLATAFASIAHADQAPAEPAGANYAAASSVKEDLLYLRGILATQTLRLDESEQTLQEMQRIIELQTAKIGALETALGKPVSAAATKPGAYLVKRDDTLYSIAQRYKTTVAQLSRTNKVPAPYLLDIGQRLIVPVRAIDIDQPTSSAPQQIAANGQPATSDEPSVQPAPAIRTASRENGNQQPTPDRSLPREVGIRPDDDKNSPYLPIFSDVGGILTPKGTLFVEPEIDYATSADNRFFFQGVEIVDAILIGLIEATDTDRRAVTQRLGFRYGLTDRLEIDGRIAYVSRDDRIAGVAIDDTTEVVRDLSGAGFGDIEFGAHLQLNEGAKWPYVIANLRAKAPTGKGPFDVARATSGIETELATGSGYWSLEPSLTFILPSDPAVIFANFGYQSNMSATENTNIGAATVREFNPGDAIRASVGVGLSLNERLSINFGYDQSHFMRTRTVLEVTDNGAAMSHLEKSLQPTSTVGSFLFGGSYVINERIRINLNTSFGATDDAPDMRISLRAQYRLFD